MQMFHRVGHFSNPGEVHFSDYYYFQINLVECFWRTFKQHFYSHVLNDNIASNFVPQQRKVVFFKTCAEVLKRADIICLSLTTFIRMWS